MMVAQVARYAWMTSRSSSGSSCSERAVEPTRSQNITVNWRRSAEVSLESRVWGLESGVVFLLAFCPFAPLLPCLPMRGVPQAGQNLAVGLTSCPQLGQARTRAVPHSSQNLA